MPRGIPADGKRAPGAGRPPLGPEPLVRTNVWLLPAQIEYAKELADGNLSAGVRRVLEERQQTETLG